MKKSIYITASIFMLAPLSINATTLADCQAKCGTATTTTCACDSNEKSACYETTDCTNSAYASESACTKANPGKTCSRMATEYRTLSCYACNSADVKNLNITKSECAGGGPASDTRGYYSYTTTCNADALGPITVNCFLPN